MIKNVIILLLLSITSNSYAANLVDIYKQALISDPYYNQAISTRLSTQEGVPISFSSLLPSISTQLNPSLSKQSITGAAANYIAGSTTTRGYNLTLNVNQTIFDFGKIANLQGARALSKQADANLSAAMQDLMIRVAKAYFSILLDEENARYSFANKSWLAKLLYQVNKQYDVGLNTITDVYATQANYDTAVAQDISAANQVQDNRENLRVITGKLYVNINKLNPNFPFLNPNPSDMEVWVKKAIEQNWSIKAAQYAVVNKLQNMRQQFSGHLPTINVNAAYGNNYSYTSQSLDVNGAPTFLSGPTRTTNKSVGIIMNLPIFSGGYVTAQTQKAKYDYQAELQTLEQTFRNTLNTTRQSYLDVTASISKIHADMQAIKSAESALEGMNEGYRVGTKTIIDVLQQQQSLFNAQKTYAQHRYDYIINFLTLKQAAGTLSGSDIEGINSWLQVENNKHE